MPTNNTPLTRVVFRKYPDGEIVALFPDLTWIDGNRLKLVTSYMHVGQHSAAQYDMVIDTTKPATEAEYKPLYDELTKDVGYNLLVMQRRSKRK